MIIKKKKAKLVKRWRLNQTTQQFEQIKVRIDIVGSNVYFYQGRKLITDKMFMYEDEAIMYEILQIDAISIKMAQQQLSLSERRADLLVKFAGKSNK